jgi:hypothetical protein
MNVLAMDVDDLGVWGEHVQVEAPEQPQSPFILMVGEVVYLVKIGKREFDFS